MIKYIDDYKKSTKKLWIGEVQSGKTSKIIQYIKNNYKNFDIIFFIAGTNNLLLSQSIERVEKEFENFSNSLKIINLKSLSKNLTYFLKQHKTYLITLLKGTKQLQTVEKYILEANTTNINILIIDDESDYASVTTYDNEYSTIYKLLNNFTNKPNISYEFISVTATPYANLIDNEKTSPIKYDDVTFFSNNENYFGIEKFMQHPEKFICVDENKYSDIRELEKIIYKSILTWLFSTARALKVDNMQKSEFLINIDSTKEKHNEICLIVQKKLNDIYEIINNPLAFSDMESKYFEFTGEDVSYEEGLLEIINNILTQSKINILNGDTEEKYTSGEHQFAIIIGGSLISRGFTFENLITELILNAPEKGITMDTLMQRARWFGYRKKTFEYIHIILNNKLYDAYVEYYKIIDGIDKEWNIDLLTQYILKKSEEANETGLIKITNKK